MIGRLGWAKRCVTGGLLAIAGTRVGNPQSASVASLDRAAEIDADEVQSLHSEPYRVVREISDPHTGLIWWVERDAGNPAGPGRMVTAARRAGAGRRQAVVITKGDKLMVEEYTARVNAILEAVALGSATAGSRFAVRLTVGGKVVRAMALAPGRAALLAPSEVWP